jgi:lysophospholipid acyltransferase (LPLAT)-like uncharacterized protein
MKLRNPFLIQTIGLLGATIISRLINTLDLRADFGPWGFHPPHPRDGRFIYVFWHDSMLLPTLLRTRAHILISQHADGELIAQTVRHFRFGVVRGSSTRGGSAAIVNLKRVSQYSHLCVTPDGPRGPRRVVQPGAVFLSSQTRLPIVPVGIAYSNAWRARSWDQFAVPLPFSQARSVIGEPVVVPPNLTIAQLSPYVQLLQERMTNVTADAERWANGVRRKTQAVVTMPFAKSA